MIYIFLVLAVLEAWHRSSIGNLFTWALENSYVFFLNFLILLSLFMLLLSLIGRPRVSLWITSYMMLLIFTISRIKMSLKGEPLLPWDIFLGNEAANIREYFVMMSISEVLILSVIAVGFLLGPLFFSNKKVSIKARSSVIFLPLILFLLLYFEKPVSLLELGEVNNVFWDQSITYQRNGLQVGFLSTLQLIRIDPPEGYSEQKISKIVQQLESAAPLPEKNPNMIIVMNEAFWDPTRLPNLTFSEDPLPFFRQLQKNRTSGELMVPVFGGSTANTEFEILTGNSIDFLPPGSTPYSQYVHEPHPSLASIFRNEGYKAVAIHGYHNWFYRRDHVYRQFGFDRFVSQNFFENPEFRRQLISDREMSRQIILEHKNSDKPLFVFAVTMQNHGPYNAKHYPEDRVTVEGNVPEDTKKVLNTYSTGVKEADESLQLLVDYFEGSGEPTVIVFFGDHLPYLGGGYRTYTETNYLDDANPDNWSKVDYQKMYTVPFVIWDNFSVPREVESTAEMGVGREEDFYLNSSFLGSFLLDKYGLPQTPLARYQNLLIAKGRSIISTNDEVNELTINDIEQYKFLQYDQLFGEGFAVSDRLNIVSNEYQLGSKPLKINHLFPEQIVLDELEGELPLVVEGENFTYKTKVYINDEEIETTFQDSTILISTIPNQYLTEDAVIKIRVTIKDSKSRELSTSEVWELPISGA